MTVPFTLVDASHKSSSAAITPEGEVNVIVSPHPPIDGGLIAQPFRQFFTDDGTSSGSNTMAVNGSVTNVPFSVKAVGGFDIYIKYLSVIIGDGGSPALNLYGALAALTNGVEWHMHTNELGDYELHDGIKSNVEFIRIGNDTAAIGTGTNAFLADVSGGGTEKSYLPSIDLSEIFGLAYGVRLRQGTNDQMVFTVKDDLSGLTTHNIIAYGLRIPVPV